MDDLREARVRYFEERFGEEFWPVLTTWAPREDWTIVLDSLPWIRVLCAPWSVSFLKETGTTSIKVRRLNSGHITSTGGEARDACAMDLRKLMRALDYSSYLLQPNGLGAVGGAYFREGSGHVETDREATKLDYAIVRDEVYIRLEDRNGGIASAMFSPALVDTWAHCLSARIRKMWRDMRRDDE